MACKTRRSRLSSRTDDRSSVRGPNTSGDSRVLKGRMSIRPYLSSLLVLGFAAAPTVAQDRDEVGLAIVQSCGSVDQAAEGVLAGTVTDTDTGVPLDGAVVVIAWQVPGEPFPGTDATRTSDDGFFLFCHVPGGYAVDVYAEVLDRRSEPVTVGIESAMLQVEHLEVEVSDPTEPGFVTGRVVDVNTRQGIANAEIRVRDTDIATLSNDRGMFSLMEMPYGIYVLEVGHLAYSDRETPLRVAGGLTQNVEVELAEDAMELEGLTISVEPRRFYNDMEGLMRRMNLGFGAFLTRNEIEVRPASRLPELLVGLPGVRMAEAGRRLVVRGRMCTPMVFMDGRLYKLDEDLGLNEINTFDIEALEFYKGTASIPAEFNYSNNTEVGCGAIVIWTRRGR